MLVIFLDMLNPVSVLDASSGIGLFRCVRDIAVGEQFALGCRFIPWHEGLSVLRLGEIGKKIS